MAIRRLLLGAGQSMLLIPMLFFWRFGEVGGVGWGTTLFFIGYCLLAALGLYFQPHTAYHAPTQGQFDWADRVGAFWLVSCVFGPLAGWLLTAVFPLTVDSWRWLYGLRFLLAAAIPLLTALPLTRYLQGRAAWVALPLLLVITSLPIGSVVNVSKDLWSGPVVRSVQGTDLLEIYLQHTGQIIGLWP